MIIMITPDNPNIKNKRLLFPQLLRPVSSIISSAQLLVIRQVGGGFPT